MARLGNWDFFNTNVQSGLTEGQFLNSGSAIMCAGPPSLGQGGVGQLFDTEDNGPGGDVVFPMGTIASWGLQQQIAIVPVPEAGSYKRYTVTGPADGSVSLGRTLYHGPSILRALYAYFDARANPNVQIRSLMDVGAANLLRNPHNFISDVPGHENFFINLASSLFTQPVGLLLYMQDVNRESYGAVYLEQVQVASHSLASGPGQLVIAEQISASFARARPLRLARVIPLMSRISSEASRNDSGVITIGGTERTVLNRQRLHVQTGSNV